MYVDWVKSLCNVGVKRFRAEKWLSISVGVALFTVQRVMLLRQNVWSSWAKHLYEDRGCTVEAVSLEAATLEAVSLEALDAVS